MHKHGMYDEHDHHSNTGSHSHSDSDSEGDEEVPDEHGEAFQFFKLFWTN